MKLKIIILLIFIFPSCGFKAVNQNYLNEYLIQTNITGDKRISYLLRNELRIGNEKASRSIKLNIETKKNKIIKEKNIKNEIKKYEITISAQVNFYSIEDNKSGEISISNSGIYQASNNYNERLNSEKKLINNLVKDISEKIVKDLALRLDEL